MKFKPWAIAVAVTVTEACPGAAAAAPEQVHFQSERKDLGGELYRPKGEGPFPAVLYNHGSAPGMLNSQAAQAIGPLFAERGWIFFMPYRRGQGTSAGAGPYIGDEIARARKSGGADEAAATLVRLLETDHLQDQLAALQWLRTQAFVQPQRIATAGNSFGGVQVVLGASRARYCAAVDASGGAESWAAAPALRTLMTSAAVASNAPVFFFQAENDYDLAPSKTLSAAMTQAGKDAEMKIYPPFGRSERDGHSFAYLGSATWFGDVFGFIERHCKP